MRNWITFYVLLIFLLNLCTGGSYLFYLPFSSKSNKLALMPMVKELARRGHSVTVVSPNKEKITIPGVKEIINDFPDELFNSVSEAVIQENSSGILSLPFFEVLEATIEANRAALSHEDVQKLLLDEKVKVDVVVTIPVFGNEAGLFVSNKKNASLVIFSPVPYIFPNMASAVGNPVNPSYMPLAAFPYKQSMNLKERFINTMATTILTLGRTYYILPKVEKMIGQVFPNEGPVNLDELALSASLMINLGSPFMGDGLRPMLPNTIQAGLMGCGPGNPLQGELRKWVEGAEHGVIYMSFGSVIKASQMSDAKRKLFISVLSQLKQRIIWKWDKEMPDAPENVLISSWLPQIDILAHPNVKLFITHGGAGSIQETICHKTPVIGIPIQGDQVANLAEAITKNLGIVIDWVDVTEHNLLESITKILDDPSYQESVTKLQNLILDRPIAPLDAAVWGLEYLLRHPHNLEMRSPTHDLYWFQYLLLDVISIVILAMAIVIFLGKGLFRLLCGPSNKLKKE